MVQTLDALALAALPEDVLIPKLAKWFRDRKARTGGWLETGWPELGRWVRTSFGPLLSIDGELEWLTTPAVKEKVARGLRVELEWHKTRFRVYHPDGRTSTLPWRKRS